MSDLLALGLVAAAAYVLYRKFGKSCCADCAAGAATCGGGASAPEPAALMYEAPPYDPAARIGTASDLDIRPFGSDVTDTGGCLP